MRIRVAFRRKRNPIVTALCLSCAACAAALALGGADARVRRQPPRPAPDAETAFSVTIERVDAGEFPGRVYIVFKNNSGKPVAAIGYGRVEGGTVSMTSVLAVPGPIPPGGTYARPAPADAVNVNQILCVIHPDGSVEGRGPLARAMITDYNVAVRTLRRLAARPSDADLDAELRSEHREHGPQARAGRAGGADSPGEVGEKGSTGAGTVRERLMKISDPGARLSALREAAALFQSARQLPRE